MRAAVCRAFGARLEIDDFNEAIANGRRGQAPRNVLSLGDE